MVLFAGLVLPPSGKGLIDADSRASFHVADSEKHDIARKLRGKPVKFEHKPDLHVGSVRSAKVQPNGSVAIVASIDPRGTSLTADYARGCLKQYRGLSLCHKWTGSGNIGVKDPIEVSLCSTPRRPGCYINVQTEDYNRSATMNNEASMSEVVQDVVKASAQDSTAAESNVDTAATEENNPETQAMLTALDLADKLKQAEKENEQLQAKLDEHATKEKQKLEAETKMFNDKIEGLKSALQSSWDTTMGKSISFENASGLFDQVAQQDPKLGHELLQLIEVASSNAQRAQQELHANKQMRQKSELEAKYQQMLETQGCASRAVTSAAPNSSSAPNAPAAINNPYVGSTNASSARNNPYVTQAQNIKAAFNAIGGSGGAVHNMQRLVEVASRKRQRPY